MRYRRLFEASASYFFTLVTHDRVPVFRDAAVVGLFRRAVEKVKRDWPFSIEAEVVLPDHIHTLWTLPDGDAHFPRRIRLVKATFTRLYLSHHQSERPPSASRVAKGEQSVWQRRYWEHLIKDERDFQAHLDYIHINPVRHGLVSAARDWPYSTFRAWVDRGRYELSWGSEEMPPLPDWVGRE